MRLASKIFGASTLIVVAVVGVAGGSLLAVDRLVRAHREISDESLPALQLEVSLQEAVPPLVRLEARYLVLKDRSYGEALRERVDRASAHLERLDSLLRSPAERRIYRDATAAFASYRAHLSTERSLLGRGDVSRALRLSEGPARAAVERFDDALTQLTGATTAEVARAQTAVRALEGRTWTTVLVTLSVSVVAAPSASAEAAPSPTYSVNQPSLPDASPPSMDLALEESSGGALTPALGTQPGSSGVRPSPRDFGAPAPAARRPQQARSDAATPKKTASPPRPAASLTPPRARDSGW